MLLHLELPLPMVVPTPGAPYNGQGLTRLQSCTRHTHNDTIDALGRRVWRRTTTEKIFSSSSLSSLNNTTLHTRALLRPFLQGTCLLTALRTPFTTTICLIGVRAAHLV